MICTTKKKNLIKYAHVTGIKKRKTIPLDGTVSHRQNNNISPLLILTRKNMKKSLYSSCCFLFALWQLPNKK
ncbi:hypothetical protein LVDJXP189_1330008 [Flavobacterium psychrophilum]|nr:hypothetical protein LVDJXP189_1330008 [Flavobacterium psychrophilum]